MDTLIVIIFVGIIVTLAVKRFKPEVYKNVVSKIKSFF